MIQPSVRRLGAAALWACSLALVGTLLVASARDRATIVSSDASPPLNATSHSLITVLNPYPVVIDHFTHVPDDIVAAVGGGPFISFSGLPGHRPGDSERTAVEIRSRSRAGNDIEETALDVEMKDTTGLTYIWRPRQGYPPGAYVSNGVPKRVYQTEKACVTSEAGGGPTGTEVNQADGTCAWVFKHLDNDGKSASLISGTIGIDGGKLWGQAIDVIAERGSMGSALGMPGGLMIGQEIDIGNFAKDCPVTPPNCLVAGLFIAGSSEYKGTAGILGGGQPQDAPLYHQGIVLLPYFASDVGFNDDSNSNVGFQSNGTHGAFSFQDLSTSPTSINVSGTHAFAGYVDTSLTPVAVSLQGSYSQYQIKGAGFSVDPLGLATVKAIKISPVTVASLPTCEPNLEGLFAAVSDATSSSFSATVIGNGAHHVPVYCNGSSWIVH